MRNFLLIILLFTSVVGYSQILNVNDVENPKLSGGYVCNQDNILDKLTVEQINGHLSELEENDHYQVAVVCLRSIGDLVPKDFSTELAEFWGVGEKSRDNGLLILLVLDQRRIEFETGYGTEMILTDILSKRIQQNEMLPYFRDNNYDSGMLAGVNAVCQALEGRLLDENTQYETDDESNMAEYERRNEQRKKNFWLAFFGWHLFGVAIYLIAILIVRYKNDPFKKYNIIKNFGYWLWAVLFPLTHIFLVLLSKKLMVRYRNQVRFSGRTNMIMHKLTEIEEDEFLTMGQQAEEIVKSVDYDVWVTDAHDDFCVLSYRPLFTKYTACPKCKYRTYFKEYDRISVAPTYNISGEGEKKYKCSNCKYENKTTYHIPRLRRSSRTSGGSWSSGGSSSGGSWGGGGSFGGGSFGGGGSGSSW